MFDIISALLQAITVTAMKLRETNRVLEDEMSVGDSLMWQASYSSTPLSSTSVEMPRNSLPLLLESFSQDQSAELTPQKHSKFIFEGPTMAKI